MITEPPLKKKIMAKPDRTIINIDAQKQLAKLLATEDIQVTVGNFKTAYFDVKNRVLGLPAWNTDTKEVSDLLVGHEVGHALFTPEDGIEKFKERYPNIPFDIANIVEDIRIEKMIQFKYPGLVKSFNDGYAYFKENDLFEIKDKDVDSLGFIDRINLKGKLRNLIDIKFSDEETVLFNKVNLCKTYDDVLDVIKELCDFIEEEEKKNPSSENAESEENPSKSFDADTLLEEDDGDDFEDGDSNASESNDPTSSPETDTSMGGDAGGENTEENSSDAFKSETQDSLDKHLEELGEISDDETILNSIPEKNIENLIFPIDQVREVRKSSTHYDLIMNDDKVNSAWIGFKNSTKKNVMILCKEFERRKAAHSYSRATQSQTGTINVNKLHSYKYDDRIFKSITNLADAKNHGMNIYIDNSGSMGGCISDVIKQTIQLIMFCKTVGIPFSVYSFTSKCGRLSPQDGVITRTYNNKREFYRNNFNLGKNLEVFNTEVVELMNSSLNKRTYETALKELFIQGGCCGGRTGNRWNREDSISIEVDAKYAGQKYKVNLQLDHNCMGSDLEEMGGTPLIETLIISHSLIKKFRKKHNVEKMITVFLTDGEGQTPGSFESKPVSDDESDEAMSAEFRYGNGNDPWGNHRYIKVGKTTVDISRKNPNAYSDLVEIIKKDTGSKMIGFFLTSNQKAGKRHAFDALAHDKKLNKHVYIDKCKAEATKQKSGCYSLDDGFKFDTYFIIDNLKNLRLNDEDEYEIPESVDTEDLNKASNRNKLATSFKKFNTTKRQSRIFLNKFIDTVI